MALLQILLISIVLVGLAFAGFGIKMFFSKKGEFRKSCASIDPSTGQPFGCTCGKGEGGEACDNTP